MAYADWREFVPKSCGKALDCVEIRIDSEDPQNVVGQIQARGRNIMSGYFKNEEATKAAFTEDGWMNTGDLGIIDKNGNIFIKGRSKSMILTSNGQNIYPEELEALLNNQAYIIESVVIDRKGVIVALIYLDVDKLNADGIKSSIDKFYTAEQLKVVADKIGAAEGDLILILSGAKKKMQGALGTLRLEMGNRLGLRDNNVFAPLWVCDFPLLEWDDETQRFYAMHHPFTAPKPEHLELFYSDKKEDLERVCANAYDFVLNGTELGGGSIRIHEAQMQERMFEVLGISKEDAEYKFGFIINAFKFGAPPHGGLAFGFDRICALFGGQETIRDYIAFPKNNQGRDVMIDSPSAIDASQMEELFLESTYNENVVK
jgi:aspartyl-tRNA synthetase